MRICVIGTGYVGLVAGTCLAESGNDVICVDSDEGKVKTLTSGTPTIYEPGLSEYLRRNLAEKRLSFTTDLESAVKKSEVVFIAVGTPTDQDNRVDISSVVASKEKRFDKKIIICYYLPVSSIYNNLPYIK